MIEYLDLHWQYRLAFSHNNNEIIVSLSISFLLEHC